MSRQLMVWVGLALTLVACWWVDRQEQEASPVADVRSTHAVLAHKVPTVLTAQDTQRPQPLLRQADTSPPVDLFSPLTMQMDTATAPVSIPEPVNPYTYDGRVLDGRQWVVFLTDGTNQFSLREGDHFANGWKVRRLTESLLVLQNGKIQHTLKLANESLGN